MTIIKGCVCSLAFACLLAAVPSPDLAQAQIAPHLITVPVDETTIGDVAIISDFFQFSPAGTEVSQSLRRIFMAAIGEMTLATVARITPETATLTLDDGSVVALQEGDTIQAQPKGVGPIFVCEFKDNPHRRCQPVAVCHPSGGKTMCMPVPPVRKCSPEEKECPKI
jgi:hypothetical protein